MKKLQNLKKKLKKWKKVFPHNHMTIDIKKLEGKINKIGWLVITKNFRNGSNSYALRITEKIISKFNTWEKLLDYISEKLIGGFSFGYTITVNYTSSKPKQPCKTLIFKKIIIEKLVIK